MKEFSITALARVINAHLEPGVSGYFTGVSTDSRTIQAGDCFFALAGENFDGADFVADAFARGAACAVVGRDIKTNNIPGRTILRVADTVKALGNLAREYRRQSHFKVVAITGSAGKTTVRQIIYHLLAQHYSVFQSPKNFNNKIGLPLTILASEPEHQIIIAELGSNYPGEIAYLTGIAQPDIAVITNVYPAHLEGFGNLRAIVQEKLSIVEGLANNGILIINADFAPLLEGYHAYYRSRATRYGPPVITFGKSKGCHYQARDITSNGFSSRFSIEDTEIYLPLAGQGNIENALAAWAVCRQFGLTVDDFARVVKTLRAPALRAEWMQIGTLTVLNDCYNANPASMENALDILTHLETDGNRRLVFICGDMAELGHQSEQLHADLGVAVTRAGVQLLITVGKQAKIAAQAALAKADYNLQTKCFDDVLCACNNLHQLIRDYDIILVKGSRVGKLELATDKLKELFA